MTTRATRLIKAALSAMHYTGAHHLMAPYTRGCGVIFMLHRVAPDSAETFEPNRILRITPEFLDDVIKNIKASGVEFVTLDDARDRLLTEDMQGAPFACLTFDDGYRDNLEHALPILRRHAVPATIYIPSRYPAGGADLWWLTLEQVIRVSEQVQVTADGETRVFATETTAEKDAGFAAVYWWLRQMPENVARSVVRRLAESAGVDAGGIARDLIMNWDEVRTIAADPLISIGGHTCYHMALANLPIEDCIREISTSIRELEEALSIECRHFAYPYGDSGSAGEREFAVAESLGLATAVTTRKGLIHASHRNNLMSLPRLSLNGDFQNMRYIEVLMSGLPFALWNLVARPGAVDERADAPRL